MKTILYFIGLKIAEIGGAILVLFGLGTISQKLFDSADKNVFACGVGAVFLICISFCAVAFLCMIIRVNWEYAKKKTRK